MQQVLAQDRERITRQLDRERITRQLDRERITRLLDRVRQQPSDFCDAAARAPASGGGSTRLNHLFRLHLHTTPAAFLRKARVEAAQRTLIETDRPLMDAGYEAGFESGSGFYENFRRLTGLSPRAWRQLREHPRFILGLPALYVAYMAGDLCALAAAAVAFSFYSVAPSGSMAIVLFYALVVLIFWLGMRGDKKAAHA